MTETELLRLPEIPEGPPAEQLKAMKRYLCRLAEQLEYILTNERRERLREQERCRTLARAKGGEGHALFADAPFSDPAQMIRQLVERLFPERTDRE